MAGSNPLSLSVPNIAVKRDAPKAARTLPLRWTYKEKI